MKNIRDQIYVIRKRISISQSASRLLNLAVLSFLATVCLSAMAVVYPQVFPIRAVAICTMAGGIVMLGSSVCLELFEDRLSCRGLQVELSEFPEISGAQPDVLAVR